MKKLMALLLALMLLCSLTACGGGQMEELAGVWEMTYQQDADTARGLLECMEFYEEEIALADLTSLQMVLTVEFTTSKDYCYSYDIPASKEHVRSFYDNTICAIYEGRNGLTDIYGYEIINMTEEEFKTFYAAELFNMADYDALLNYFVENCLDYEALTDFDRGYYRLEGSKIICDAFDKEQEEEMSYSLEGDTLTLIYVDGKEVYTRK